MKSATVAGLLLALSWSSSYATIVNESGDTGDVPASASILYGEGSLTQINGFITGDSNRVDMYGIYLSPSTLFGVTSQITSGTAGDLNVYLFDDQGRGIAGAKQGQGGNFGTIVPTYEGLHFIAVAQEQTLEPYAQIDPATNSQAPIFTVNLSSLGYHIPGGPAANLPVYGWGGAISGNPKTYGIFLRGAQFVPVAVPEPSTLGLLGAGLLGLFVRRRRAA